MGWARGDSASGSCPARSEGGIQRAIQTYHQRAPRAKQDTTTGRECFRGGSERHRTHGQQEAASNTGHTGGRGNEARPQSGPREQEKRKGQEKCFAPEALRLDILPVLKCFFFCLTLLGTMAPLAGGLVESGSNSGSPVQRAGSCGPKAAARHQSCLRARRRQQSGTVR